MTTDAQLLSQYRAGSQAAFSALVERHIDWVHAAALRRVGNTHLADEVTQAVFVALAQNAPCRQGVIMSAWMFTVLRFASAKALRDQSRRRRHEAEAARQRPALPAEPDEELRKALPLLEHAMDRLGRKDRQAILLRFYQRQTFGQVGAAMGVSEDGARKRIGRAIEKLRGKFAQMGLPVPAAALIDRVLIHAADTAPSGLAASITGATADSALARAAIGAMKLRRLIQAACLAVAALTAALTPFLTLLAAADDPPPAAPAPAAVVPATAPAIAAEPATRPVDVTFAQVIANVKRAEGTIQNLYIKDFETTEELSPNGASDWVWTPERFAGSAWYDGQVGGKIRVYFADQILPWMHGRSPWAEQVVDFSWNGREARTLRIAGGAMGTALSQSRQAMISATEPLELSNGYMRWETGAGFSLQYLVGIEDLTYPRPKHVPLSAMFEQLQQRLQAIHRSPPMPEIVGQTINGFDTIRVRFIDQLFGKPVIPFTWWFDPQRGYALVKSEREDGLPGQMRTSVLDIKELKEIAPGIWFPLRGSWTMADVAGPAAYRRFNYHAADAVANDPHFDESIFVATLPTGYLINDDTVSPRKLFMVMPDGTRQLIPPHGRLPIVQPSIATRPDQDQINP
jgi:RNA polymerase sigma factor (sigma-70 family)